MPDQALIDDTIRKINLISVSSHFLYRRIHILDAQKIKGMSKKHVVFFEAEGGSDKGLDGFRKDTFPMIEALQRKGWTAEVVKFRDEWKDLIFEHVLSRADAYVSRINPGNLPNGESVYFETLRKLSLAGVIGMPHPDAMINFGAKDALTRIVDTGLVPRDTFSYYTMEEFRTQFPRSLSLGERVLKQNRGSTGRGIWRVKVADERHFSSGEILPGDTRIKCTEAVDNHVEYHTLDGFMNFCGQYIEGENGMLVDMKFLPRIREGEIRILMVGSEPVFVVHKKPADSEDAFSATLFSGARYTYDPPEKWGELVRFFQESLPRVAQNLGGFDPPLIWTSDFILDTDAAGKDVYVVGEFNASCVGFTSQLDMGIQDKVADEIIRVLKEKSG